MSYIILIISLITLLIPLSIQSQLRWAFEIFRHGARTPYSGMTSDFVDCFGQKWFGLKELTGVGLYQHFLVGYRNRLKYMIENKLLKEEYDPREVFLITTDSNRTIMSANAQIQGLYPPGKGPTLFQNQSDKAVPPVNLSEIEDAKNELDENQNYSALPHMMNVIPVHSFFNADHFIQLQDKKVCKPTIEYYQRNQKRKEVTDFIDTMTEKYGDDLQKKLRGNETRDVLKDYTKAYYIFDTIISRNAEGYPLPTLGNATDEELLNDSFKFFDLDLIGRGIDNDSDICLHSMSPIFDRILKWINLKIEKDKNNDFDYKGYDLPKFVMFSAHDSTCGAFMGFMLNVFGADLRYTYFATNINLELYLGDDNKYYIEYIINDESILNITYDDFVNNLTQKMKTTEEINKFCQFTKEDDDDEPTKIK